MIPLLAAKALMPSRVLLVVLAGVAVAGVFGYQKLRIWGLEHELRAAVAEQRSAEQRAGELAAANGRLTEDLRRQNARVAALAREAAEWAARGERAASAIERRTESLLLRVPAEGHGADAMNRWATDSYSPQ